MITEGKQGRYILYDNLKYFLMVLVVLGHFLEPLADPTREGNNVIKLIFLLIYMVHMPLFIFVSGLLQKQYENGRTLNLNKVLAFIVIGYLYKLLNYVRGYIVAQPTHFHLFWEDGIPWFMFVMAFCMVLMYLFRDVKPWKLFIVLIVLACAAGYDLKIDDTLCLSRTIIYFPFYALGYYLTPDMVLKFSRKKIVKVLFAIGLLLIVILCVKKFDVMYSLRHLFTGRNSFDEWDLKHGGALLRIMCYILTLIMGTAIICFVPNIHLPVFTKAGQYTLRIYFWHLFIIKILNYIGFTTWIHGLGKMQYPVFLLAAIALSLITTLPVFAIPVDYVLKLKFIKKAADTSAARG